MGEELFVLGKSVRQKDGVPRVTGAAKFYGDVLLLNMLHAKVLRGPYPQADIAGIDTSEAEALPGVYLVMTHKNFPKAFRKDLHYVGEDVAAVIADDEQIAEEACDLIKVEYEPKPFVLDLEQAMKPDAPRVFPNQSNVQDWTPSYYLSEKDPTSGLWTKRDLADFHGFGDVEEGFRQADVIVEESGLKYAYAKSPAMEPRGCVASFENGRLTVWTHSQGMHHERLALARQLGLRSDQVNYVSPYTGGSFGGKLSNPGDMNAGGRYLLISGLASMALDKPVRLAYSREEEMLYGWSRGSLTNVRIGFEKDGTMTTMDMEHRVESGSGGEMQTVKNGLAATGCTLYSRNCKHLRARLSTVCTNRLSSTGWQGFGCPEVSFAVETVMDKAAEILKIHPIELRKKNHFRTGDIDQGYDPLDYKACYLSSSGITECLDQGAEKVDWHARWRPPGEKTGSIRHGLGMAIFAHIAGRPGPGNSSSAVVKVFPDASAMLICARSDMGQGQHTVQSQIVAEVLGIPYENVSIVCHDTDSTPWASIATASSSTWLQGWATYEAALEAKRKVLELAAPILEVKPDGLDIKLGLITVKAEPEKSITFEEAFGPLNIYGGHHELVGYSYRETPNPRSAPEGHPERCIIPKEKGAQFVSLDVDTETGKLQNVAVVHAQNVGRALNPKIVEGQFLGVRHAVEHASLGCECIVDNVTGRLLSNNWLDYRVASMLDCRVVPIIVELHGDPTHPFGATACSEGVTIPTMAVFGNALYNATGIRLKESPFTPDRILKALGKI